MQLTLCAPAQALYRGNGAHVIRLVPEVALRFTLHDRLRVMCSPLDGRPIGPEGKLMAGALTGTSVQLSCMGQGVGSRVLAGSWLARSSQQLSQGSGADVQDVCLPPVYCIQLTCSSRVLLTAAIASRSCCACRLYRPC